MNARALTAACAVSLLAICPIAMAQQGSDPTGTGPEPAVVYSDTALPSHTIYRPADMRGRYPVVLWGNGSCIDSNFGYREFLAEVASHGFIVLAIGPHRETPPPRLDRPEDPALWPPFETRFVQMLQALDWIAAENDRPQSEFFNRIVPDRVATMGHSCGGLQSIRASVDPRVTTALVLNSGMMADDDQYMHRHDVRRSILGDMHAPIAYFIGGESDIAWVNAEQDWQDLQRLGLTAINANMDVGHGATYSQPGGGPFADAPLAWLRWQLQGNTEAREMFVGDDCGLCSHAAWTLRRYFPE